MKIYLISQDVNNDYDTYSDAVVCAKDEDEARHIHPSSLSYYWNEERERWLCKREDGSTFEVSDSWAPLKSIKVNEVGTAKKGLTKGIICSSFHAG